MAASALGRLRLAPTDKPSPLACYPPLEEVPFAELLRLHQLIEQLAHVVSGDLTPLQSGLHTHLHKHRQDARHIQLLHALHGFLWGDTGREGGLREGGLPCCPDASPSRAGILCGRSSSPL